MEDHKKGGKEIEINSVTKNECKKKNNDSSLENFFLLTLVFVCGVILGIAAEKGRGESNIRCRLENHKIL